MSVWLILSLCALGYGLVGVATYVLTYAPLYRKALAKHEARNCYRGMRCPCQISRPPRYYHLREREFQAQQGALFAEYRATLCAKEATLDARNHATFWGVFWAFKLVGVGLCYAQDGLIWFGTHAILNPIHHIAETPLRVEALRTQRKAEATALLERFERETTEDQP